MICGTILLFCVSNVQAQKYTVLEIKGTVKVSIDGKPWKPLKEKKNLKETYKIKMIGQSSVIIVYGNSNSEYKYKSDVTKIVSVAHIIRQGKTDNKGSDSRSSFLVTERSTETFVNDSCKGISVNFIEMETQREYTKNHFYTMPAGTVFYIEIDNKSEKNKIVNVYQELDNNKFIPYFSEDIFIEKNTTIKIKDILFEKEENNNIIIYCKEEVNKIIENK